MTAAEQPRRTTLRDVARVANVSTATVSYVLSGRRDGGDPGISPATTQRVLAAAEKLNYRPNTSARSIRTGRSGVIQLSLTVLDDPWALATAKATTAAARAHNLTTVILGDADWQLSLDRLECDVAYVDGVHNTTEELARIDLLVAQGQRLVLFSDTFEPNGFDVIRSRDYPGCLLAMQHLAEAHTRIGCLATHGSVLSSERRQTRYTAYREGLAAAGIEFDPGLTATYDGTTTGVLPAALELLGREPRPTAVFALTDFAGVAVTQAAHMLGLSVPDDVAVIGAGNSPVTQQTTPSLSTVGPTDFFAQQADIIVAAAIEPDHPPRLWNFDWSLHLGGSTDIDAMLPR